MSKVNWDHIKEIWLQGAEELSIVAEQYRVTLPEISLKAKQENWPDRGAKRPLFEGFDSPVLDDKQVLLAHKTDLGRLRLIAATVLENMQFEIEPINLLKSLERLSKIYNTIIPLERKVFGMDSDTGDLPDGIIINIGKKDAE